MQEELLQNASKSETIYMEEIMFGKVPGALDGKECRIDDLAAGGVDGLHTCSFNPSTPGGDADGSGSTS